MLTDSMLLIVLTLFTSGQDAEVPRKFLDLIEQLGSDALEKREQAVQELKGVADAAFPALQKAARERGGEIASRAKDLVRWIEVQRLLTPRLKRLFPDLERSLLDGERGAWSYPFASLKDGFEDELEDLTGRERGLIYEKALAESDDDTERIEILEEAFFRPAPMDPSAAIALLGSKEVDVRKAAARALGAVGGPKAVMPLRSALQDAEEDVRWRAAEALGQLKAREAIEDLRRLLARSSILEVASAASALGWIGDRSVEPDLRALLTHKEQVLRKQGAFALADLGTEDSPLLLAQVLRENEYPWQQEASERLAALGPRAAPALRECLKAGNVHARQMAVRALGKIGGAEAAADIEALAADPEPRVREAVADTWAALNAVDRTASLARLLVDPHWEVRRAAADALGSLGAKDAAPGLRPLLKDPAPYTQIAAAASLCRLGDESGVPVLLEESADRYKLVKQVIPLTELNAIREREAWARLASVPLAATVEGRTPRVLQKLCEASGLKLQLSQDDSDMDESDEPWMERRLSVKSDGRRTVLEALLATRGRGAYDYILEGDTLRVIPHSEAIKAWSAWWKARPKK